ncbi:MAG: AI-2E family transporter [Syntrophorhabdaceae bacterium]|nr:AI-2E family transporter [Syntrophorhabdaceae bacterium]
MLLSLVAVFGYLTYRIISPFLSALAWATVISIVFYPLYLYILRYVKWKTLSSTITICFILFLIFGPLSYLTYLLTVEVNSFIEGLKSERIDTIEEILNHPSIKVINSKLLTLFKISEAEFYKGVADTLTKLGKESMGIVKSGLSNFLSAALDFVFMVITVFFILTNGPHYIEKLGVYFPFSEGEKRRLASQAKDIITSTIYGGITVAAVQGFIGGITLSIMNVSSPVLWGLAIFLSSFIPLFGTFVVWGPIALYLLIKGLYIKSLILTIVGIFGISMADNILRPLFIKGKMKMPIILIFFSIIGGIKLFGFIGFIMGPLVVALFISILDMFRTYFQEEYKN